MVLFYAALHQIGTEAIFYTMISFPREILAQYDRIVTLSQSVPFKVTW